MIECLLNVYKRSSSLIILSILNKSRLYRNVYFLFSWKCRKKNYKILLFFLEFPTTRLEMEKVAEIFDRNGDGFIDHKEYIDTLRPDREVYNMCEIYLCLTEFFKL